MLKKSVGWTVFAMLAILVNVTALSPQPIEKATDRPTDLTVEQALNVAAGLEQLSGLDVVIDGKPMGKAWYKFSGDVRILIAVNIEVGRAVQQRFSTARNAIIMQMSDGTGRVAEEKAPLMTVEVDKLMKAPARAGYSRMKMSDLRLDENPIPGPVLSLVLPILDR